MLARHSRLVIAALVAAFALASTSFVSAADTAWTGATNGLWATSSNWSGSAVPTAADNVFLTSPAVVNNTITLPGSATANRLVAANSANPFI
jgi:multidrug efflux pump subunit AcrA (membrane-fusion protein)